MTAVNPLNVEVAAVGVQVEPVGTVMFLQLVADAAQVKAWNEQAVIA